MQSIISVKDLSKRYSVGQRTSYGSLRENLTNKFKAPWRLLHSRDQNSSDGKSYIWAVKDVSFEVERGEVLGLVGRNGAGKSTVLKILSRITQPTAGRVELYGRVRSLLEVGTGFHPELTGRENVYLNGAVLGMRRREIARRFDEIVSFAEVERFIDTPVKFYSSGMYVRLGFSVAAHLEPEILLVDEVLAVGDAAFWQKSTDKMRQLNARGMTIVVVTHNMGVIQGFCTSAMLLNNGSIAVSGSTQSVVASYQGLTAARNTERSLENGAQVDCIDEIVVEPMGEWASEGEALPNSGISVSFTAATSGRHGRVRLLLRVASLDNVPYFTSYSEPFVEFRSRVRCCAKIERLMLQPGAYIIWLGVCSLREVEEVLAATSVPLVISGPPDVNSRMSLFWNQANWEVCPESDRL